MDTTENWSKTAVVYHIYPRSFKDSNGDGVGDINGIIEKLDYLNDGGDKSLGVDAIWLSPVYKSPMADFGYDVADYQALDPLFGNLEDFDRLIQEAHKRNLRVMMDFVPNHTSSQHPWFLESKSSRTSPKRNWYIWADPSPLDGSVHGGPPNNWLSVFGGSSWEWDQSTGQYYYHSFLKDQPDLNWRNPEVVDAMKNVLRFWLKRGVDGFRVDAINWLVKDGELRNDPVNPGYQAGTDDPRNQFVHLYSQGQDETLVYLNEICKTLCEYGNKFMVTELHAGIADMIKYYRACANMPHSPFNFNLIGMPWNAQSYKEFVDTFEISLEPGELPNYVLGNHDKSRVATRIGQDRARASAVMQFTLRGMPFIYYGEEIGMEDVKIPPERVQDPFEKNVPGLKLGRDPERTPMLWDDSENAGFTSATPWLPLSPDYRSRNVQAQLENPVSTLALYKNLIRLRKNTPALLYGKYVPLDSGSSRVFAYVRKINDQTVLVAVNFSENEHRIQLDFPHAELAISSIDVLARAGEQADLRDFSLLGNEACVFRIL